MGTDENGNYRPGGGNKKNRNFAHNFRHEKFRFDAQTFGQGLERVDTRDRQVRGEPDGEMGGSSIFHQRGIND